MNATIDCWTRCRLLVACAGLALASSGAAAEVWVVTDRTYPVRASAGVRVIELDALSHIERALGIRLPSDPGRAAAVVRERMNGGGAALQRKLVHAYQGIVDAWSLSVTKIPAVIVDRRYIVYGERDVERALREIERYRSAHL